LAFTLDMLKGMVVVGVARATHVPVLGLVTCGLAVILGHQFPVFLNGRGGKGLATALGFILGMTPASTVIGLALFGLTYLALHDFNTAVGCGIVAIIVLPLAFQQPFWVPLYTLTVALLLALKKLIDRPHEQRVWARDPWSASAPGEFQPKGEMDTAPATDGQLP
jgi:glycerol-3-phosphate acyltransferase PlsY